MLASSGPPLVIPALIVGLGNPGPKYARTRHNVGFDVVDRLAHRWQISLSAKRRFQGEFGEGMGVGGQPVKLLKPLTYMNQSGQSIRTVLDWFKLSPASLLVIYDDMDLPLGKIRLRLSGSAGGHNGIKSTISRMGTVDFPRLRVGIGPPQSPETGAAKDSISHVLGRFSPQEKQWVTPMLDLVVDAVEMSLRQGVETAMSRYNGQSVALPS